ncbi:hypothetical protein LTR37_020197 [Vermiconidia calcicola]|uniref:Uncharacterized protein n=1 Tax=Vermiconidia calcicola TaxID=1690605 RepID=A0ACC3MD56_9PEZI|nr:hypothetical protein LTR37_020197 [Vermiconidia calcicola]
MSGERHKPNDLLKHLPEYGVVICRACSFAVQPQALASHLLKHRIYRNERQQLLDRLSRLALREPEDVPTPASDSPPLRHLPLYNGYVCLASQCSHSCVSQKRMFQHWSEAHDEHDSKKVSARSATLQTFFRGNKIRYFQVNGSIGAATSESETSVRGSTRLQASGKERLKSPSTSGDDGDPLGDLTSPILDVQALRYFRHYTLSPYLIPHRGERESEQFWADTIVEEAYKHQFLMHGILGIGATHSATVALTRDDFQLHRKAATQYQSAGMASYLEALKQPDTTNSTALIAFSRFIGIQRAMSQMVEESYGITAITESDSLSRVFEMFSMFRGTIDLQMNLQHLLPPGSDFMLRDMDIAGLQQSDDLETIERDMLNSTYVPPLLFNSIDALPRRLSEHSVLTDSQEYHAVTQATATLLASAARSYAADSLYGLWNGLDTFTHSVPDHFVRMLEAQHTAALVMFAHWCPLLSRLETHYVCLQDQTRRLLDIVKRNLSPEIATLITDIEQTI